MLVSLSLRKVPGSRDRCRAAERDACHSLLWPGCRERCLSLSSLQHARACTTHARITFHAGAQTLSQ
eukprot:8084107-Lingulodinium_polyedra.AAC.1